MTDGLFFLALVPTSEIVGGAVGQVLDGLHLVLAECDQHRRGKARHFQKLIGDAELLAPGAELGFKLLQTLAATGLYFSGRVLVEAFDRRNLSRLDESHFLDGGEAFRSEQLSDHLVHVERFHECCRAFGELCLAAF